MKPTPRLSVVAAILLGALAGCSNTPSTETPVAPKAEDTKPATTTATAKSPESKPETAARAVPLGKADGDKPLAKPLESIGAPDKRSVYFDYDKYDIREEFKALVSDHTRFIIQRKDARMLIQGNADERGSREYNLALGQRRSDAVKKSMLLQGAKEEQLESVSLGEEKPKATGHDEAAWAENRRADILYKGEY